MFSEDLKSSQKLEVFAVFVILVVICLFTTVDIISDLGEGATWQHLAGELVVAILSLLGVIIFWRRTKDLREELSQQQQITSLAESDRAQALQDAARWREESAKVIKGLSDAVDAQLSKWTLTSAEKEVALLLLKGLSLKEIASVRGVSEKTARAQSFAVYAKSGLSGRAELSAFFLEDLMLPSAEINA